jgi:hypothetical protein
VRAALVRHLAMLGQNQMDCYLPCELGSAIDLETRWRCKGTDKSLPNRRREQTPQPSTALTPVATAEPIPFLPGTPPAPPGNNAGADCSQLVDVPPRYPYVYKAGHCAESLTLDASDQDS